MKSAAAVLAALLAVAPQAGAAERHLLDEIVAVVESQTITLSELAAETRIRLVETHGAQVADAVPDRALLAASLRRLVEERVVLAEVDRLKIFDIDRAEVDAAVARLRSKFQGPQRWEAFLRAVEMSLEEVASVLARELRVARYLDNRLKLAAQLRESELEDALRSRGTKVLPGEKERLREQLSHEKYERLLRELLAELRRRADVRILDPLDQGAEAGTASAPGGGPG